jgi:hypothetical protein
MIVLFKYRQNLTACPSNAKNIPIEFQTFNQLLCPLEYLPWLLSKTANDFGENYFV